MNSLERAVLLKQEAGQVLAHLRLVDLLHTFAPRVQFTGSYFLDVLAYPDIDVEASPASIEQVFAVAARLARTPQVTQVVYEPSGDPRLPGGLYLKPRIAWGNWGRPWKIDIWFIDEAIIDRQRIEMRHFQQAMTPELRRLILDYKNAMLTPEGRTPMNSGYWIYQAFMDEGLRDFEQVTQYLSASGIKVAR